MNNDCRTPRLFSSQAFGSLAVFLIVILAVLFLYCFPIFMDFVRVPSVSAVNSSSEKIQLPNPLDPSSEMAVYQDVVGKIKTIEAQNIQRGDELLKEIEGLNQQAYSGLEPE